MVVRAIFIFFVLSQVGMATRVGALGHSSMVESNEQNDLAITTALRYDPILYDNEENTGISNYTSHFYMLDYHRQRLVEAAQYFQLDVTSSIFLEDATGFAQGIYNALSAYVASGNGEKPTFEFERNSSAPEENVVLPKQPLKVRILIGHDSIPSFDFMEVPTVSLDTLFPKALDVPKAEKTTVSSLTGGTLSLGANDSLPASTSSPPPLKWALFLDTEPTEVGPYTTFKTNRRSIYDTASSRAISKEDRVSYSSQMKEAILYDRNGDILEGTFTSLYFLREGTWVTPNVMQDLQVDAQSWVGGHRGTSRRWALSKGLCSEGRVSKESVQLGEGVWVSNGVRGFSYGTLVKR